MRVRKGNTAVTMAVTLTTLLGFGALVVDVAWGRLVKQELQQSADAAAHAATVQLDGTSAGVTLARASAKAVAAANAAGGEAVSLTDDDIEFGVYDGGAFTASTDATVINAVRVEAARPGLALYLAPVIGRHEVDVGAQSTMVAEYGGSGEADCYLPFAVPSCLIEQHGGLENLQDFVYQLQPAGVDNIGWALPNGTPNANTSRELIQDSCSGEPAHIGDPVGLQNGAVQSALTELATALNTSDTRWSTDLWGDTPTRQSTSAVTAGAWGNTVEGIVAVFDGGTEYCKASAPWNGNKPIVGFMWGAVYDTRTSGSASDRNIKMRLDVSGVRGDRAGSDGGGPDWGVTTESPPHMIVD
jgi:Flp pilus assembly protein TadG